MIRLKIFSIPSTGSKPPAASQWGCRTVRSDTGERLKGWATGSENRKKFVSFFSANWLFDLRKWKKKISSRKFRRRGRRYAWPMKSKLDIISELLSESLIYKRRIWLQATEWWNGILILSVHFQRSLSAGFSSSGSDVCVLEGPYWTAVLDSHN